MVVMHPGELLNSLKLRHLAIATERNDEQYLFGTGNLAHLLVITLLLTLFPGIAIHGIS